MLLPRLFKYKSKEILVYLLIMSPYVTVYGGKKKHKTVLHNVINYCYYNCYLQVGYRLSLPILRI